MKTIIAVARLYLIQVFSFCAVSLSMYIPGLDLFFASLFLLIVFAESRLNAGLSFWRKLRIAGLWQGPAILLAVFHLSGSKFWILNDYGIFLLQFWGASLLPLWSLFNINLPLEYPLYYYLVLMSPAGLFVLYLLGSVSLSAAKSNKSVGGFR